MTAYLIRRLWQMIPTLIGVVLLVFFLFKYFGGDPAEILGGLSANTQQIDAIREQLGLNKSTWEQLYIFFKQIVTFDWGKSWATNESVANLFATRLPATLTVMVPILLLDVLLAIPFALAVAYVRGSLTDRAITAPPTAVANATAHAASTRFCFDSGRVVNICQAHFSRNQRSAELADAMRSSP